MSNEKNKKLQLQEPIAVIGLGCLFPGARTVKEFWQNIVQGKDLMTDVPRSYWLAEDMYDPDPKAPEKTYCKRGAFLPEVPFDPVKFGIPPNVLSSTDSSQLLSLLVAKTVLEDAVGCEWKGVSKDKTSVILGYSMATSILFELAGSQHKTIWERALRESQIDPRKIEEIHQRRSNYSTNWDENCLPGLLQNVIAGRIANRFDLHGTNCVIDAACASSFSAIHLGVKELIFGDSDMVVTGGVQTLAPLTYICFSKTPTLSPRNESRPFDESADGMMMGEGIAMFALRRLTDAERDGNKIYSVIRGIGTSSDGRAKSIYAPEPKGQALALRRAYERTSYDPESVELIEAHGTGTTAGDIAELQALKQVFEESGRREPQWCAVGSIKSQIGHTLSTAGAAGLFKTIMALHHKVLPPTINVENPLKSFDFQTSPFYINTEARPWVHHQESPRRASVSSFGFGGTNFHITLEEYSGPGKRPERFDAEPTNLFLLSAYAPAELLSRCRGLIYQLENNESITKLACETHENFDAQQRYRLTLVANSKEDLISKLQQSVATISKDPESNINLPTGVYYLPRFVKKQVAFLFPGQGSQTLNMSKDLAIRFDCVREIWDRADHIEFDESIRLSQVTFPRPTFTEEEKKQALQWLTATVWAQPALGAACAGMIALLERFQLKADFVAGHSFGELTALYYAGVFDLETFLRSARKRGELMAHATYVRGGMVSVLGSADRVQQILTKMNSGVVIANHNSPHQSVISGELGELHEVQAFLEKEGMKTTALNVETAFHSPLVSGSVDTFYHYLSGMPLKRPNVTVYSNTTASTMPTDVTRLSRTIAEQLGQPIRFWEEIDEMYEASANVFVEVGPGSTLTRLLEDLLVDKNHIAVNLDSKGRDGMTSLYHGLARLSAAGIPMDLSILHEGQFIEETETKVSETAVMIDGTTYKKKYPPIELQKEPEEQVEQEMAEAVGAELVVPLIERETRIKEEKMGEAKRQEGQRPEARGEGMEERKAERGERKVDEGEVGYSVTGSLGISEKAIEKETETPRYRDTEIPKPLAPSPVPLAYSAQTADANIAQVLLDVVADKTGYPIDILKLDMHLEADLGIDSIKRVEIMSAIRDKLPGSPEADSEQLAQLETLGQIVDFLSKTDQFPASSFQIPETRDERAERSKLKAQREAELQQPSVPQVPEFPSPSVPPSPPPKREEAVPSEKRGDIAQVLLDVVADKTGYPIDILKLDMHLEADLGIDSIKRVEIMSAIRDKLPSSPEADSEQLAQLETLGQIVNFLGQEAMGDRSQVAEERGSRGDEEMEIESTPAPQHPSPSAQESAQTPVVPTVPKSPIPSVPPSLHPSVPPSLHPSVLLPSDIGRYELRVVPCTSTSEMHLAPGREIVIVSDGLGIAEVMAARFQSEGYKTRIVQNDSGMTQELNCGALIYLGGLRSLNNVNDGIKLNKEVFRVAKYVAFSIQQSAKEGGGWFITVQDLGGDFGLSSVDQKSSFRGGLAGLTKTIAKEWEGVCCKAIDIDSAELPVDQVANLLVDEILRGGDAVEVGLSATGDRNTIELVNVNRTPPLTKIIDENSVIVASGGARGVTAACMIELARQCQPKFVLLGRSLVLPEEDDLFPDINSQSELKEALFKKAQQEGRSVTPAELEKQTRMILYSREIKKTLTEIQAAGSEVRYYAVDIQESRLIRTEGPNWAFKVGSLVRAVLDEVRRDWGPITGLVHGAGVLADKLITDKTAEQFDIVFDTKVRGLTELLSALDKDPLKVICLFSSTAARSGNRGQSDYAMANEVLNKMAQAERMRRGGECLVKSINWGPWEGGMVDSAHRAEFERKGVSLIPIEVGAMKFVNELQGLAPHKVEVVIRGIS